MINEQIADSTRKLAGDLFDQLKSRNRKIVFAESCTAGLVSAVMAGIPGVSTHLCGSSVTYQNETKECWLQVEARKIQNQSSVSADVTTSMARSVLRQTPHADMAVAITGHLQTDATPDGSQVWVVAAMRKGIELRVAEPRCFSLLQPTRIDRQWEAARHAFQVALDQLGKPTLPNS